MIKFFRKIRKRLLTENKFGKYSLYATGEILILIIGILIALQVNNSNEQWKKDKLKNEYITSLISDLKRDTTQLGVIIKQNTEQIQEIDNLEEYLKNSEFGLKDLSKLPISPRIKSFENFNNNTFIALRNSGNYDLFDSGLKRELIDLNSVQEEYIRWLVYSTRTYLDTMNEYLRSTPIGAGGLSVFPEHILNELWANIDFNHYILTMNAMILQKHFTLLVNREWYQKIKQRSTEVIKLLEEELNN